MVDEDFESFDNVDDLDWSDIEDELKQNREQVIAAAGEEPKEAELSAAANEETDAEGDLGTHLDINFLLDVQLKISVEVGRTKIFIVDLLELKRGAVVELETLMGQPLDIRVNDKLVARGEVVVINDKFGVRITQIVSPDDRFAALH